MDLMLQKGIELGIDVGVDYSSPPKARPAHSVPHASNKETSGPDGAPGAASPFQSSTLEQATGQTGSTPAVGHNHDDELPAFHPGFSRQHAAPDDIEALTGDDGHLVVMYPLKRHGRSLVGGCAVFA
jgi:hypothetical protein